MPISESPQALTDSPDTAAELYQQLPMRTPWRFSLRFLFLLFTVIAGVLFAITFGYRRLAVTKQDEQIAHSLVGIAVDLCILARSQHGVLPSPNLISGD